MLPKDKGILLLDGLGALISAVMLGMILPLLPEYIGAPVNVLWALAVPPTTFLVFDLAAYWWSGKRWRQAVGIIAVANLVYCNVSAILLHHHRYSMTTLGYFYFVAEIAIVLVVAFVEVKVSRTGDQR